MADVVDLTVDVVDLTADVVDLTSDDEAVVTTPVAAKPPPHLCVICITELAVGVMALQCGHVFHGSCLETWANINPVCPTCRVTIQPDDEENM